MANHPVSLQRQIRRRESGAGSGRGGAGTGPRLTFREATAADASGIAELRTSAARDLTRRFGHGPWSGEPTERGVLYELRISKLWIVRSGPAAVATFRLGTRKPWAIDRSYFSAADHPLYLTDMVVRPDYQRRGVGRRCLDEIGRIARAWPADAIRLDAYDAEAGAGGFYDRCGFRHVGNVLYRGVPHSYHELMV